MLQERICKIRVLDEKTINQIAAGEVVENPASVVKELIENAIDANATQIAVETKAGGRQWIRISDNGCGMERDDVFLCLERHATSKISSSEDLHRLNTLGFRGEAVPSIASISKLTIQTSPENGKEGTLLSVEGGKITEWRGFSRTKGTTFEVKSLFYNVPVRKKFQRSVASDTAEIHKILIKTALCFPHLCLSWKNDEKLQFEFPEPGDLESRILPLFGEELLSELLFFEERQEAYNMQGFIGRPSLHRSTRAGQYLFINERPLFSKTVSEKILQGYGSRLPTHRYPVFILHLRLPGEEIDVNVHPQKKEVRLTQEEKLGQWILNSVEKALEKRQMPTLLREERKERQGDDVDPPLGYEESYPSFSQPPSLFLMEKKELAQEQLVFFAKKARFLSWIGKFALLEAEGIQIMDVKAAHARVFYEHAMGRKEKIAMQSLLFPISFSIQADEAHLLEESLPFLSEIGFEGRFLSGNLFVADAIPVEMDFNQVPNFIEYVIRALKESSLKKETLFTYLCQLMQKRTWKEEEVLSLYEQLLKCEKPFECPQGKRTLLSYTEEHLAKEFER